MKFQVIFAILTTIFTCLVQAREFKPLEAVRPRPADFDAYWDSEIARQRTEVPLDQSKVIMEEVKGQCPPQYRLWSVEIPALSKTPVRGLLTIPTNATEKSMPIVLKCCGAGTKSADKPFFPKAIGFCISPYGAKNLQPDSYYEELFKGELNGYMYQGWESRETCWFHGQIMRLVRALEWIKTLKEWDGKNLIVTGKSMGGSQALQAGALDPDVSICAPEDPALCDHSGDIATTPHLSGWPQIYNWSKGKKTTEEIEQIMKTADYFDNCHFSKRIKCKAYFASGYCDRVCPSEGVYIAYMNAQGWKVLTVDPMAGHCRTENKPFNAVLNELTGKK